MQLSAPLNFSEIKTLLYGEFHIIRLKTFGRPLLDKLMLGISVSVT